MLNSSMTISSITSGCSAFLPSFLEVTGVLNSNKAVDKVDLGYNGSATPANGEYYYIDDHKADTSFIGEYSGGVKMVNRVAPLIALGMFGGGE